MDKDNIMESSKSPKDSSEQHGSKDTQQEVLKSRTKQHGKEMESTKEMLADDQDTWHELKQMSCVSYGASEIIPNDGNLSRAHSLNSKVDKIVLVLEMCSVSKNGERASPAPQQGSHLIGCFSYLLL